MKRRSKKIHNYFVSISLCGCILLVSFLLLWFYHTYLSVTFTPTKLEETSVNLSNPYCGWYQLYGYTLSDQPDYTQESLSKTIEKDKNKLALLLINLKNYRNGFISQDALLQLDSILSEWEKTDKKLIIRFLYDWDGAASETEPSSISIVCDHISQVCPIINNHASSIFTLQGIFVGNYGEMHNSKYMTEDNMSLLLSLIAESTDPSIYLSVRTPAQWRQIATSFKPLTTKEAFTNSLIARTGLFNDGMLGSNTDCGTYADSTTSNITNFSDKQTREEELSFQKQLCQYVPNGGEAILDNPFNDFEPAIKDFFKMHTSYLNRDYDLAVLNKWKNSTYQGDDIFSGCTGYDYITKHLGYRYVLRNAAITFRTFQDNMASLKVNLENVGFANCYYLFHVSFVLKNSETGEIINIPVDADSRTWLSNEINTIEIPLNVRSYDIGNYEIYFCVMDNHSKDMILFANTNIDRTLGYSLGTISIKKFSKE